MQSTEQLLTSIYHAFRQPRRRFTIRFLSEYDGHVVSTRELARQLASFEEGVAEDRATGEPYRNAYNALSQTHLPTLSDANIIIYDSERQTICSGKNLKLAALLLEINMPIVDLFRSFSKRSHDATNPDHND